MKKRYVSISIPIERGHSALWTAIQSETGNDFIASCWSCNGTLRHHAEIDLNGLNAAIKVARAHGYKITDLMI